MDIADNDVSSDNCIETVTASVDNVAQENEKKKVRRRKRKPKILRDGIDTTDDAGCAAGCLGPIQTNVDDEVNDVLKELLMKMANLKTASTTKINFPKSTDVECNKQAENIETLDLPSTSEDKHPKVKKQRHKKKKTINTDSVPETLPSEAIDSTKENINAATHLHELFEDISTDSLNAPVPSVLDLLVGVDEKSPVKPKKKKSKKKSSQLSEPAETTPKGSPVKNKSPAKNKSASSTKKKPEPKPEKPPENFEEYFSEEQVTVGLQDGSLISGVIRINQRNYKEAYISSPSGDEKDVIITGLKDRNRSLEGDEVIVMLYPEDKWKTGDGVQKTGKVVCIKEYVHPRLCIGQLQTKKKKPNSKYVLFSPKDSRVPRLKIYLSLLPEAYLQDPSKYENIIFQAKLSEWTEVSLAEGVILGMIGPAGEPEVETVALLLDNNIDARPYSEDLKKFYPEPPFVIPEEELNNRADLRKECIFTIDPMTAQDLDDAVSLKELPNGNFEVGVHISDVSYFLHYNNPLDKAVRGKATSVYLVQRVYHMLPDELCMICSLIPGQDKLAFSVIFEITPNAEVVSHRFTRSVIHSCTKFAYEHAQAVIDNPDKDWSNDDFPTICNGFQPQDCANVIKNMYKLSVIMRNRRFANGALRIDQPKLYFELHPETGLPINWNVYELREANRLIEEFMLLANGVVAEHIYNAYPKIALLRSHKPPQNYSMKVLADKLSSFGIHLDIDTAGGVHSSLMKYDTFKIDDIYSWARKVVLNYLCTKGMKRATYICAEGAEDKSVFHHYALNVPFYTHFTSPIRRYPDIMVHRLLEASLGVEPEPTWTSDFTAQVARNCNLQKNNAKVAGEQSSLLFLTLFIAHSGPVRTYGAVIEVKDHSFDVILHGFCITLRIYTDNLDAETTHICNDGVTTLDIKWKKCGTIQVIQLFSVVTVVVSKNKDMLKLEGTLVPPQMLTVFHNANLHNHL